MVNSAMSSRAPDVNRLTEGLVQVGFSHFGVADGSGRRRSAGGKSREESAEGRDGSGNGL
jgi:hypothetical protein